MTVKELIDVLSKVPPDTQVIYRCCSEYEILEADEIRFVKAEDKQIILHHGRYMDCQERWYLKKGEPLPTFVDVVAFPGN